MTGLTSEASGDYRLSRLKSSHGTGDASQGQNQRL